MGMNMSFNWTTQLMFRLSWDVGQFIGLRAYELIWYLFNNPHLRQKENDWASALTYMVVPHVCACTMQTLLLLFY